MSQPLRTGRAHRHGRTGRTVPVRVTYGDGIGPDIMEASLTVLLKAGADIAIDSAEIGDHAGNAGNTSGMPADDRNGVPRAGILYKAPVTATKGGRGINNRNDALPQQSLGIFAPRVC